MFLRIKKEKVSYLSSTIENKKQCMQTEYFKNYMRLIKILTPLV